MPRRALALVICLVTFLSVGGAAAASGVTAKPAPRSTVSSTDGIDPAEQDAVTGRLGYHENRDYPYGLLVFLVVMTPVALGVIRRWTPRMEGDSA